MDGGSAATHPDDGAPTNHHRKDTPPRYHTPAERWAAERQRWARVNRSQERLDAVYVETAARLETPEQMDLRRATTRMQQYGTDCGNAWIYRVWLSDGEPADWGHHA